MPDIGEAEDNTSAAATGEGEGRRGRRGRGGGGGAEARRALRRLGLHIELRDAKGDAHWRSELLNEGGRIQVPCLRIPRPDGSVQWLYESDDIIAHLEQLVADRQISAAA